MANNRLYIRCKGCSGFMAFAKFYPSDDGIGWYTHNKELGDDFNNFFEEHGKHNEMDNYGQFWDLVDEMDDRVKLYDYPNRKILMEDSKERK